MLTQELVTDFERYLLTERRVARNTFDAYRRDVQQLLVYMEEETKTLTGLDEGLLVAFLKHLKTAGITARSMARKISCLKTFFLFLHTYHGFENYAQKLIIPKLEKTLPHYAQEDQVEQLLEASHKENSDAATRNRMMLYLLYSSGMRISELVNATVSGLNSDERNIKIMGKGGKERIIPLPEPIILLLQDYLQTIHPRLTTYQSVSLQSDILFPTVYGGKLRPITRQSFWLYLKELALQAGLPSTLSPHQLRHSLATHLLKRGMNIRSLQMLLGHENISTVQIYTHLETSHLRSIYDKKHPRS